MRYGSLASESAGLSVTSSFFRKERVTMSTMVSTDIELKS